MYTQGSRGFDDVRREGNYDEKYRGIKAWGKGVLAGILNRKNVVHTCAGVFCPRGKGENLCICFKL